MNRLLDILKFVAFVMFTGVVLNSCGIFKKNSEEEKSFASLRTAVVKNQIDYKYFNSTGKIDVNLGSQNVGASFDLRIVKDSVIWIAVKKFGFEVARVLVNTDSLHVVSRFNKTYYSEPISKIEEMAKMPANMGMIQELMIGNLVLSEDFELKYDPDSARYNIYTQVDRFDVTHVLAENSVKAKQTILKDENGKEIIVLYDDYKTLDTYYISYFRSYLTNDESARGGKASFYFSDIEIDQSKSIKFEIPANYTKTEL